MEDRPGRECDARHIFLRRSHLLRAMAQKFSLIDVKFLTDSENV